MGERGTDPDGTSDRDDWRTGTDHRSQWDSERREPESRPNTGEPGRTTEPDEFGAPEPGNGGRSGTSTSDGTLSFDPGSDPWPLSMAVAAGFVAALVGSVVPVVGSLFGPALAGYLRRSGAWAGAIAGALVAAVGGGLTMGVMVLVASPGLGMTAGGGTLSWLGVLFVFVLIVTAIGVAIGAGLGALGGHLAPDRRDAGGDTESDPDAPTDGWTPEDVDRSYDDRSAE